MQIFLVSLRCIVLSCVALAVSGLFIFKKLSFMVQKAVRECKIWPKRGGHVEIVFI